MKYALVGYEIKDDPNATMIGDISAELIVFAPFGNKQDAHDYADEFGGMWSGYNIVEMQTPKY